MATHKNHKMPKSHAKMTPKQHAKAMKKMRKKY